MAAMPNSCRSARGKCAPRSTIRLFGTGLVKLDAGYDRISLLQDRILTDEGFDAPGNIGTGKRAFVALAVDAPLDRLGIKGARVKLNGQLQRTRVEDPISGETRNFTGFFPDWEWSAECAPRHRQVRLRHDGQRPRPLQLLPRQRDRHQLQQRALRHRLRRISAQPSAPRSPSMSTICSTPRASATACSPSPTAPTRRRRSTSSASAIRTSIFGLTLKRTFGGNDQARRRRAAPAAS